MFTIASFIPGPSGSVPMNTAASIVACISYVSVIVTFIACVRCLLWKKHVYSKRMQIFLLCYVSAMFLLATSSFFQELAYFSAVIFPNSDNSASSSSAEYKLFNVPVALPFTIWGADAFIHDVEMLHAAPGIITVSSPVNLSSPIVSCCGYNLQRDSKPNPCLIHPLIGHMNGIVFIIIFTTAVNILLSGIDNRSHPSPRKSLTQTPWDQTSLAIY